MASKKMKKMVIRAGETPAGSNAEKALRARLVDRNLMKDKDDDRSLLRWIRSLHKPMEDARSKWEQGIQKRLEREGVPG